MKALTIRQPWASLIALGVKTIETRSWSTRYRGPIAIHAGKQHPAPDFRVGDWTLFRHHGVGPLALGKHGELESVPLGAIVATANLVDVVPMVGDGAAVRAPYVRIFGSGRLALRVDDTPTQTFPHDITDQRPYGDFAPGRYAWLLDNIKPSDPIPAKGRQGLWDWQPPGVIACSIGCCPGCQHCYGMSIGCHQEPCRCDRPCTCRYEAEGEDPTWRDGCDRHDDSDDQRRIAAEQEGWTPDELDTLDEDLARARCGPCPDCGAPGACGWDAEGRPLIHAQGADE